jgi:Na+/citrate or Na+/malate symporter
MFTDPNPSFASEVEVTGVLMVSLVMLGLTPARTACWLKVATMGGGSGGGLVPKSRYAPGVI